ncbi:MAG TPA: 7-carboxy-7-deazaguanine synthase [Gammaproteobacteria bacterium]|nr:7-carboxy-7-deazaguanine synthase [Gammaproteobacteria bacterium]
MYQIKEMYYTLQGEGARTGRPSVFCRFTGCNLWSGREKDRSTAVCNFCDTDFVGVDGPGGGKFINALELSDAIESFWPNEESNKYVVFTGGEPGLQLDKNVVDHLHLKNFEVAVETNGTLDLPLNIDWLTVSPKADSTLKIRSGNELKLVYPQENVSPNFFEDLDFEIFYLQPMDNEDKDKNTQRTIQYCLENPRWKLSLQTHKYMGIA